MRERVSPVKPAKIPSKRGSVKTSATSNSNGTSPKSGCGVKSDPTCVDCGANIGDNVRALQCDRCCDDSSWKCSECLGL